MLRGLKADQIRSFECAPRSLGRAVHGEDAACVMCLTGSPVSRQEAAVNEEPHCLVTDAELRLQRADEHGIRCHEAGMSSDEIGRDLFGTSDPTMSPIHQALIPPLTGRLRTPPRRSAAHRGGERMSGWRSTSASTVSRCSTRRARSRLGVRPTWTASECPSRPLGPA